MSDINMSRDPEINPNHDYDEAYEVWNRASKKVLRLDKKLRAAMAEEVDASELLEILMEERKERLDERDRLYEVDQALTKT